MTEDVCDLSIAETARRFRAGALRPAELVEAQLDRIDRRDGQLHAFIRVTRDVAVAQAEAAGRELAAGIDRGPLHGIPVGLKDIVATAGIPTTAHSKLLQDHVPDADAAVTARLHAAGTVLMGKLGTFEFALGGPSFDLPWPPPRHPWNMAHLPGGSSSGSAAAVGAGLVHGAIGTDTGGSIRWPAAVSGIVGLKPTYGRVSRRGVLPNTYSMDHVGPMTRTVEDAALMLQAIAGHDPRDPGSADRAVPDYRAALGAGLRGLRIGLARDWHAAAHPDVGPAVEAAVAVLERLGARVEVLALPPLRDFADCKTVISAAELFAIHAPDLRRRPQDFGKLLRNRVLPGGLLRAEDYVQALRLRRALCRTLAAALDRVELIVSAGWLGIADPADPDAPDTVTRIASIAMPFSVAGLPALCLPCGISREGLPLALQIAGRPFDEATVLRAGFAYEQASEWHRRRPDLAAAAAGRLVEPVWQPPPAPAPPPPSPPLSTPDEVRLRLRDAGVTLTPAQFDELLEAFAAYEAMARRLPRDHGYADEPAHVFDPARFGTG